MLIAKTGAPLEGPQPPAANGAIGRMVGVVAVATALAICVPLVNAYAGDIVQPWSPGLEKMRLAHDGGLGADRALPQPLTDPQATDRNRPRTDPDLLGDPLMRQLITEASNRFGLPERWIRAIILVESDGNIGAISPKGAIGLMQVMPETYADLRDRFGLGNNPYAVRDNILAGSAYLREMYDRYGSPGFIAAYNAGPARYGDYLVSRRGLPDETLRYTAAVGAALGEKFEGQVLGELPFGARSPLRFPVPIAFSSGGTILEGRTRQPISVNNRLALHKLLAKAVGVSAAK